MVVFFLSVTKAQAGVSHPVPVFRLMALYNKKLDFIEHPKTASTTFVCDGRQFGCWKFPCMILCAALMMSYDSLKTLCIRVALHDFLGIHLWLFKYLRN